MHKVLTGFGQKVQEILLMIKVAQLQLIQMVMYLSFLYLQFSFLYIDIIKPMPTMKILFCKSFYNQSDLKFSPCPVFLNNIIHHIHNCIFGFSCNNGIRTLFIKEFLKIGDKSLFIIYKRHHDV